MRYRTYSGNDWGLDCFCLFFGAAFPFQEALGATPRNLIREGSSTFPGEPDAHGGVPQRKGRRTRKRGARTSILPRHTVHFVAIEVWGRRPLARIVLRSSLPQIMSIGLRRLFDRRGHVRHPSGRRARSARTCREIGSHTELQKKREVNLSLDPSIKVSIQKRAPQLPQFDGITTAVRTLQEKPLSVVCAMKARFSRVPSSQLSHGNESFPKGKQTHQPGAEKQKCARFRDGRLRSPQW